MKDMRYLMSKDDRRAAHNDILNMRVYIEPLLLERQKGKCAHCGIGGLKMDIDHKVYNPDITINELQLLCRDCHIKKHPTANCLKRKKI